MERKPPPPKSFIKAMLSTSNEVSSKRTITIVSFILMCAVTITDLITDLTVSEYIFNGLLWIVLAGIGAVTTERFIDVMAYNKGQYGMGMGGYGGMGYPNQYSDSGLNSNINGNIPIEQPHDGQN